MKEMKGKVLRCWKGVYDGCCWNGEHEWSDSRIQGIKVVLGIWVWFCLGSDTPWYG